MGGKSRTEDAESSGETGNGASSSTYRSQGMRALYAYFDPVLMLLQVT
jgi:hypothetical protein